MKMRIAKGGFPIRIVFRDVWIGWLKTDVREQRSEIRTDGAPVGPLGFANGPVKS